MAYFITQIKIKYPATHEDVCQLWQDNPCQGSPCGIVEYDECSRKPISYTYDLTGKPMRKADDVVAVKCTSNVSYAEARRLAWEEAKDIVQRSYYRDYEKFYQHKGRYVCELAVGVCVSYS